MLQTIALPTTIIIMLHPEWLLTWARMPTISALKVPPYLAPPRGFIHLSPGIAESCYLDAVAFKPAEAASIFNSLALLYSDAERNADAIAAYNSSLQLEENVALYVNMGVQLQRAGRSLEAVDA